MPLMTDITVFDRESTPVAHIFKPYYEDNGVAFYREDGPTLESQNKLSISTRETGGKVKTRVKFDIPIVVTETINGVDHVRVVDREYADFSFTLSKNSALSSADNLIGMGYNLLATSQTDVNSVVNGSEKMR